MVLGKSCMWRVVWLTLSVLLTPVPIAATAAPAWVSDEVGETPDPAVQYGQLPNGLRFAVMHNASPKGVAAVQYRIAAGTAQEIAGQVEFAHLVEHLCFGASAAFPKGDAIGQLQSAGMQIGNDIGGFTTPKGTLYTVSVPQVTPERLALAFRFLRGVSDGPLFEANDVERQKGVVSAEIAGGENQLARAGRAVRQQIYPELPYLWQQPADRLASVHAVTAEQLRGFHDRWYRPDTAFLVIVGDIDPAATAKAIETAFASWAKPSTPLPARPNAAFQPRTTSAVVVVDPALPDTLALSVAEPRPDPVPTAATRRETIFNTLALAMVRDRIERQLLNDPAVPIASISFDVFNWSGLAGYYSLRASARPGRWRDALTLVENETRRPLTGGFTLPEVDRAVTSSLKVARNISLRASSRTSDELATGIVGAYAERLTFLLPEREFQRLSAVIGAATPDDVLAAYKQVWAAAKPQIAVTGATGLPASPTGVVAAYTTAHTTPLGARDIKLAVAKQLPLPYPPGKVVESSHVNDLDLQLVRFANGVRLTVKHTDFRNGEVLAAVHLDGGLLALPPGKRPVAPPLSTLVFGGAGGLTAEEILAGLRGSQVTTSSGSVGTGATRFVSQTNAIALDDQLRFWAAMIGMPSFDTKADGFIRAQAQANLEKNDNTPLAAFQRRWAQFSHNGDPRFASLDHADVPQLGMVAARATWGPLLADAPIEVTVVGDVEVDKVIAAVGRTLGALPDRRAQPLHKGTDPRLPAGGMPVVWQHRGDAGRALVVAAWPSPDDFDARSDAPRQALSAILTNRLFNELRQTAGATYSPQRLDGASPYIRGWGYTGAIVEVAVTDVPLAERSLRTIAASLAELGPTDEEFTRVLAPLRARVPLDARVNGWWLGALERVQTPPDGLDRIRLHATALNDLTREQVKALAAQVFSAPAITIRVLPKPS